MFEQKPNEIESSSITSTSAAKQIIFTVNFFYEMKSVFIREKKVV